MKQNLKRMLLAAALAGMPALSVQALDWVPVGDSVDANGFALTSSSYVNGDYVGSDGDNAYNLPLVALSGGSTLDIYGTLYDGAPSVDGTVQMLNGETPIACPLKVNGNVVLDASSGNMTVNVKEDVIIESYFTPPTGGKTEAGCAHVQFITASGTAITINMDHNLEFRGKTASDNSAFTDMLVSFKGAGQVVFVMADGTKVAFNGDVDTRSPLAVDQSTGLLVPYALNAGPSSGAAGTKVFVCMDDTDVEHNKVVFQRKDVASANNDQNVTIEVGPNSVFTYLSDNSAGVANESLVGGYGAVALDPSNNGTGRMVLFVRGAYLRDTDELIGGETEGTANPNFGKIIEKYQFNDGAVVVAGHYVPDFAAATISGCDVLSEGESSSALYDFSTPAGLRAVLRVIDTNHYNSVSHSSYDPAASARRGVLVVNDVQSHGKLASDPYWDLFTDASLGFQGNAWAASNGSQFPTFNVRRGFVLGVNGTLDVYHNTFIDHASASTNDSDPLAVYDFANQSLGGNPALLKMRNPSALIVDGLDPALFVNGNPFVLDGEGYATMSLFEAANPFTQAAPARANIQLRGTGAVYCKEVASSLHGTMHNFWFINTAAPDFATVDWTSSLVLMAGSQYDGYLLSTDANGEVQVSGEGQHVLDVEGEVQVAGVSSAVVARVYTAAYLGNGVFNAAALSLDYKGGEVYSDASALVRPLMIGNDYDRYNSPTLFFNNNAVFNNCTLRHSEPTHYVDGLPNVSEPGVTGGERLWFGMKYWDLPANSTASVNRQADPNRYRFPEIQLNNGTLALEESLNASGVRFVVKDAYSASSSSSNSNASVVRFFDHGDPLDSLLTGFGRILLNGSSLNLMADGSNNFVTESCFWNVFKKNRPVSITPSASSAVSLSLQNGNQFHPEIQAFMDGLPTAAAKERFADKQRSQHLFMFAQPEAISNLDLAIDGEEPLCNMAIGWPSVQTLDGTIAGAGAPAADGGNFPSVLPYAGREPLIADGEMISYFPNYTASLYVPDALVSPAAAVSVDGKVMCFGSFDKDGNSLPVPVATDNDSGVVYVKHGGRIKTSSSGVTGGSGDRYKLSAQSIFSTMLAQRVWNDYNYDGNARLCFVSGSIELPTDQVSFESNYAVQPYNFTTDMFAARRSQDGFGPLPASQTDTQGFVRISGYNDDPAVSPVDSAGIEEMLIGWMYRDTPDYTAADSLLSPSPTNAPIKGMKDKNTEARKVPNFRAVRNYSAAKQALRFTESVNAAQARPLDLLYISAGDDIKQLRVSGATAADPFMLDIAGDGVRPVAARVREFATQATTRDQLADHLIGEGAHAALFVEFGGRIGLGSRSWNEHSVNAWSLLGKDYVSIYAMGDGVVDVNSNLLVADRLALLPTAEFGASGVQRITFTSDTPREIRIPAGSELDLSAFGNGANRQEIAFGGNLSLIFETGSTLRLPNAPSGAGMVIYLTDQAKMVFQGDQATSVFAPFTDSTTPNTTAGNTAKIADARIRIVGQGQIWLNKSSSIGVNGNVFVGVETDSNNPVTDLTISLQRQSRMEIGSETLPGGAFQVGNAVDRSGHSINFTLALNGPTATFHIDREGFLGLGAGIVNKNGKPNGNASVGNNPVIDGDGAVVLESISGLPQFNPVTVLATPSSDGDYAANLAALRSGVWRVQALNNVNAINVNLQNGIFEHKNITDGSSSAASLVAVGPAVAFNWRQASSGAVSVRAGGNLMLVPAGSTQYSANIWDYAGLTPTGETYGIMASGQLVLDRNDVASTPYNGGAQFAFTSAADFFGLINYLPYNLQGTSSPRRVNLSLTAFGSAIDYTTQASTKYVVGSEVVRAGAPAASTNGGTIAEAANLGGLQALGTPQPTSFAVSK